MMSNTLHRQRGATLVVAMIMLVMLTLFALSAMNASNTGLKIASNTQTRNEAIAAVQGEIDKVMSVDFPRNPASVAGNKAVDINRDGATDYNVVVPTPVCISTITIKTDSGELNILSPADAACFGSSTAGSSGVVVGGKGGGGVAGGDSLCANSQWDVSASATDPVSGASVSIHQGTAVRVAIGTPC
jgi:hypothetical protein